MKRLVKKLALAAVGCLMVVALAGCDLLGTTQGSGLSPQLTKHRFSPPSPPSLSSQQPCQEGGSFVPAEGISLLMP